LQKIKLVIHTNRIRLLYSVGKRLKHQNIVHTASAFSYFVTLQLPFLVLLYAYESTYGVLALTIR